MELVLGLQISFSLVRLRGSASKKPALERVAGARENNLFVEKMEFNSCKNAFVDGISGSVLNPEFSRGFYQV